MAQNPCDLCGQRFIGAAIVGYHRWYDGTGAKAWKQRICPKCAGIHYSNLMTVAIDKLDPDPAWPDRCPMCNAELDGTAAETSIVWYRGQNRKDLTLIQCEHCAANTRTLMMNGAEKLEDRTPVGVREGGAPLPHPPGFGRKDDLPW